MGLGLTEPFNILDCHSCWWRYQKQPKHFPEFREKYYGKTNTWTTTRNKHIQAKIVDIKTFKHLYWNLVKTHIALIVDGHTTANYKKKNNLNKRYGHAKMFKASTRTSWIHRKLQVKFIQIRVLTIKTRTKLVKIYPLLDEVHRS